MTRSIPSVKPRRVGRGTLWLIAALLVSSGLLRLSNGSGSALARGVAEFSASDPAPAMPTVCEPAPDIEAVLKALNIRSESLDTRDAAIADRMSALILAETEITRKLAALESAEQRLSATLSLADEAAETDLGRLTSVYEAMKPKEAAALFQEMAPEFAAGFLGRMRADAAAAVLAGLSPQAAYTISVILAGRNANAPTE